MVTDGVAVTTTATVTIMQPTLLSTTVTVTAVSCNGGNSGSVTVNANGGTPGYTYSWNPSGQTSQTTTGFAAGNYTATVTDGNGCTATQTITVVSSGIITVSQSANLCYGSTYTLPGGVVVSTSGTYNDTLTSVAGCDSIITTNLTVNPNPTATIFSIPPTTGQVVTITQGQTATLTASGEGTYSWGNGETNLAVTVAPAVTTVYCVTVTDANNCTDTACVTVIIEPIDCAGTGKIYLPNAFSPNNDGENDFLQVYYGILPAHAGIKCIKNFKLVVYNRWGEKVFETTNTTFQWDGALKGKIINTTVFVYYLEAILFNGEKITEKGNISLIR